MTAHDPDDLAARDEAADTLANRIIVQGLHHAVEILRLVAALLHPISKDREIFRARQAFGAQRFDACEKFGGRIKRLAKRLER